MYVWEGAAVMEAKMEAQIVQPIVFWGIQVMQLVCLFNGLFHVIHAPLQTQTADRSQRMGRGRNFSVFCYSSRRCDSFHSCPNFQKASFYFKKALEYQNSCFSSRDLEGMISILFAHNKLCGAWDLSVEWGIFQNKEGKVVKTHNANFGVFYCGTLCSYFLVWWQQVKPWNLQIFIIFESLVQCACMV